MMRWTVLEDSAAVARAACDRIIHAAQRAIAQRGRFRIVLAGGSTPEETYRLLAESPLDWSGWHIWFGDERCLPAGHPERNSGLAERALLSRVAIPPGQVHPMPAELGAEQAAAEYARALPDDGIFDLVLLGVGEDGHTASLFPGHHHIDGSTVVAVHDAPKPPAERVSLGERTLAGCRQLLVLAAGAGKRDAIQRWRHGEDLPIKRVAAAADGEVLIDRQAMPV